CVPARPLEGEPHSRAQPPAGASMRKGRRGAAGGPDRMGQAAGRSGGLPRGRGPWAWVRM
ncbi:MAG TPA: hypothetical protein VFX27_05715, partial [Sphingobium sp.]|nr:hypothetical protein [Sphingobium sp.]